MAVKAGDLPLAAGAPSWLAASWWGGVPLILISFYLVITVYKAISPELDKTSIADKPEAEVRKVTDSSQHFARWHAISDLKGAKSAAEDALRSQIATRHDKALHAVRAAMLTASNVFGIANLPEIVDPRQELIASIKIIERILPYLDAKHDEKARSEVDKLILDLF
jgi:hypothetical protein